VLPPRLKTCDVTDYVSRELEWMTNALLVTAPPADTAQDR